MKTKRDDELNQAFVLRGEDVSFFYDLLSEEAEPPTVDAGCADGFSRSFESVEEIESFDNEASREIQRLSLGSLNSETSTFIYLVFGASGRPNLQIRMHGEADKILALNEKISARILDLRPWYAPVAALNFYRLVIAGLLIILAISVLVNGARLLSGEQSLEISDVNVSLVTMGVVGLLLMVAGAGSAVIKKLFPMATFAIGRGFHRFEIAEKVRWGVAVTLIVGVAASLIAALIYSG